MIMEPSQQNVKKLTGRKIVIYALIALLAVAVIGIIAVIYVNSGYRTASGTFDYKLTFNNRRYEFVTSSNSLDMFRIRDIKKADNDCYVYVGTYDKNQDLEETLNIVNQVDGMKLEFKDVRIGAGNYAAKHVSFTAKEGGVCNMYYIDYNGKNYVISSLYDKSHKKDIEKMLASFTIN